MQEAVALGFTTAGKVGLPQPSGGLNHMLGQHNFVLSLITLGLAAALGTLAGCARAATPDVTPTPLTAPPPTLEMFDFRTLLTSSRGGGLEPQVTQSHHPASFGMQESEKRDSLRGTLSTVVMGSIRSRCYQYRKGGGGLST